MRRALAVVLLLAVGWLLFSGEAYFHDLYDDASAFLPGRDRISFGFREWAFHGGSPTEWHPYAEFPAPFFESAHDAGTWLFCSLVVTALLLLLAFVPRLRVLRYAGCAGAVVSIGVHVWWLNGADWRFFEDMVQVGGGHGPSLFAWLVAVLGVVGLAAPLMRTLRRRQRATRQERQPRLEGAGAALPRASGACALAALVWLFAADSMWVFRLGDRSGPRGTDWGIIEFGVQGATDESGAVGFRTKFREQSYSEAALPRGAPPSVVKLWATARRAGRIAFWVALLGGLAIVMAGYVPGLGARQRRIVQCVACVAIVVALLHAKFQLDAEAQGAIARSRRMQRSPPAYGLTPAALTVASAAVFAAFGALAGWRKPTR